MDRLQPSVTSTTVVGGVGPDAIHVGAHNDGTVGIHVAGRGVYVSLFGTLEDMADVSVKIGLGIAKIATANTPDPTADDERRREVWTQVAAERLGTTP